MNKQSSNEILNAIFSWLGSLFPAVSFRDAGLRLSFKQLVYFVLPLHRAARLLAIILSRYLEVRGRHRSLLSDCNAFNIKSKRN